MKRIGVPEGTRLDVRDLRVVLAVAAFGTTARAAGCLHLTQPATSRALLAAEKKLGLPLFARTSAGLVLNEEGRGFVEGAARVLLELGDLERRARAPKAKALKLKVVCECYTAYHWLPTALVAMRESLPGLELELALAHTAAPVDALVAGAVDLALVTTSPVPRGLSERPLFRDEVVFLVGKGHPLAPKRALTTSDLVKHKLLTSNTPPAEARWFLRSVFGRARPQLALERFPLTEAIVDVCRANLGIGVLSEWIAGPHLARGEVLAKRLARGPLERPWRMAYRPELALAAERLAAALQTEVPALARG